MKYIQINFKEDVEKGIDFPIPLYGQDENASKRRTYQVKLSASEVEFIERIFREFFSPVKFTLPRWVGQNKRGQNV